MYQGGVNEGVFARGADALKRRDTQNYIQHNGRAILVLIYAECS